MVLCVLAAACAGGGGGGTSASKKKGDAGSSKDDGFTFPTLITDSGAPDAATQEGDEGPAPDPGPTIEDGEPPPMDEGPADMEQPPIDDGPADVEPPPADEGPAVDLGPADSGPADAGPQDAGPQDAGPEEDLEPPVDVSLPDSGPTAPSCEAYCDAVMTACPAGDVTEQYQSLGECFDLCDYAAKWPAGKLGDTTGNTIGCRLYHAGAALTKPALHCVHAGPTGGGVCGSLCEVYCDLAGKSCAGLYADDAACKAACAKLPADGLPTATTGDSLQCRLSHLALAAFDAEGECPNGGQQSALCAAAAGGETCETATKIAALPFSAPGDNSGAGDDYSTSAGCGQTGDYGKALPDLVYTYTAVESGVHTLALDDNTSGGATILYVTTDCNAIAATCLGYSGDMYGGGKTFDVKLQAGETYFIVADGIEAADQGGSFTFSMTGPTPTVCTPVCAGKECGDDGCGAACGACTGGKVCTGGLCVGGGVGIDLGGWKLSQTNATASFTLPAGTTLAPGDTLVIARKTDLATFQTFFGVTLGADAGFLSSGDKCPSINGDEAFTLTDAAGKVMDGPTIAVKVGNSYHRTSPAAPPGDAASWTVADDAPGNGPTPGAAPGDTPGFSGVYISEFSDVTGTGNYWYEFVELHYDP